MELLEKLDLILGRAARWSGALMLVLCLSPAAVADDPLDDLDGTESWDQVAPPPAKTQPKPRVESEIRREVADWEGIRQQWELEREAYLLDRARHKSLAESMRGATSSAVIDDSNVNQLNRDEGWGDGEGDQWLQPPKKTDRVIEAEIQDSSSPASIPEVPLVPPASSPSRVEPKPAPAAVVSPEPVVRQASPPPAPPPPPPVAPTALMPPPEMATESSVPSAFKQPEARPAEAGLAPGPAQADPAPLVDSQPAPEASADDQGARAAAEMIRRHELEIRRQEAEEEAQRKAEADAGAAAAAKLLQMQEDKERKEAEALRQKMKLDVDEDGQIVDPDLQEEMGAE